jgi:hypothetical protein
MLGKIPLREEQRFRGQPGDGEQADQGLTGRLAPATLFGLFIPGNGVRTDATPLRQFGLREVVFASPSA